MCYTDDSHRMGGSMKSKKLSKKALILLIVAIILVAAILGVVVYGLVAFMPKPMDIDWTKVTDIGSNVTYLAAGEGGNTTDAQALIKYNADGTIDDSPWKILQFTDMHLSHEMETTNNTIDHFIDALNREKPDFVAITGDVITRLGGRPRAKQLAEIFEKTGIYWGYVLGNHEGDSDPYTVSRKNLIKIFSSYPHCLVQNDVKRTAAGAEVWGLGNFVVNLLGTDYSLKQSLIFMDSGNEISDKDAKTFGVEEGTYDYLKDSQMTWYAEQVQKAVEKDAKTMLFIHIPLVEQGNVAFIKDDDTIETGWHYQPGTELLVNGKKVGQTAVKDGWNLIEGTASYEKCCSSKHNNGMYQLMKDNRLGVNALFCGHDHINNTVMYEDCDEGETPVYLCYGMSSGLQGYSLFRNGLAEKDEYTMRGYSVISINNDASFDLYHVYYDVEYALVARIIASHPCVG